MFLGIDDIRTLLNDLEKLNILTRLEFESNKLTTLVWLGTKNLKNQMDK